MYELGIFEHTFGESSLVTCLRLQKDQTIDASTLLTWRTNQLDDDDVFAPEFLRQIIFCGVQSETVHLESDTEEVFEDWKTLDYRYVRYLDVDNGPYYIHRGDLHSIWRLYEDRQLAFVQAIWPSTDYDG